MRDPVFCELCKASHCEDCGKAIQTGEGYPFLGNDGKTHMVCSLCRHNLPDYEHDHMHRFHLPLRKKKTITESKGRKDDNGKPQMSLLPFMAIIPIVRVLEYGASVYGKDNWQRVEGGQKRYLDACFRHLAAWSDGEGEDKESGLSHLAHAGCCVLFLLWLELSEKEAKGS